MLEIVLEISCVDTTNPLISSEVLESCLPLLLAPVLFPLDEVNLGMMITARRTIEIEP
jgi:hypothetical protein